MCENDQLWIALAGAVAGGLLTLLGDVGLRMWFGRLAFRSRLRSIEGELNQVAAEAAMRLTPASGVVRQRAPLSSEAWRVLVASGDVSRLPSAQLDALLDCYRKVETANYLSAQALPYLQIANLSTNPEVQRAYQEQARVVATEPFRELATEAADCARIAHDAHSRKWTWR